MIWESSDWKEPLLDTANWLRRVRIRTNTSDYTYVRIEKELFIGFYSVRKLFDTYKVSDSTKITKYELEWFPNLKPVNDLNWHKINDLYDLDQIQSETRDIRYICNLFVHSFVFSPIIRENRLNGVFVTSDRMKNKKVYFVSLENIISIFRLVGRDYPSQLNLVRDPTTGELTGSAT